MKNTKLYILSIIVGIFAGIVGGSFRWCLNQTVELREFMFAHEAPLWHHAAIFLSMWIVALLIYKMTQNVPLTSGSGIPQSRAVIFGRFKFTRPWTQLIAKYAGSLGAIGMGMSLGREGPSVEIGSIGGSLVSKYGKATPTEERYLTSAGAGAGLSAAFTAPIASTIFLIEDTMGWVSLRLCLPGLLACIMAAFITGIIIPTNVYLEVSSVAPQTGSLSIFLMLLALALIAAFGGKLFNIALFRIKSWYTQIKVNDPIKILAVVTLTYISGMFVLDLTSGGETELIKQALTETGSVWWLFAMVIIKILLTAVCYSTGLCGSLLLPLVVLGGLTGKGFALLLVQMSLISPESTGYFTLIGMATFFVAVVRAPISGMMLILEMTGRYDLFLPLVITGTLCYLFGEYINTVPVYHKLYDQMINNEELNPQQPITTHFRVNNDSFLAGKEIDRLHLPGNSTIIGVIPTTNNNIPIFPYSPPLKDGDTIIVKTDNSNYENLFKVFRTLTNE